MDSRTKRLLIVWNPVAGPTRPRELEADELLRLAQQAGWQAELFTSRAVGEIETKVRAAVLEGVDRVVVAGGDGSINEAIQGMVGTSTELAVIPAGTSNILANELGIPPAMRPAAQIALSGASTAIDVGQANDRYFCLMIGVGYDAVITETIWPELKRAAGQLAYTLAGIQTFIHHRASRMRLRIDGGKPIRRLVYMLVVANTRLYGRSNAVVADHADVRDGRFDLCIFRTRAWYHVIFGLLRVLARRGKRFSHVETIHCSQVSIRSSRTVPYQLDGDPAGVLPVRIRIHPAALAVVAP